MLHHLKWSIIHGIWCGKYKNLYNRYGTFIAFILILAFKLWIYEEENFNDLLTRGLESSPIHEVLIDKALIGWKEYELEVIRDNADNAIIVCSIENIDPMGVHTGDSVTVAPAMTLSDKEYQQMRNWSIQCLRTIGVETGGSNVQFAVNPENGSWTMEIKYTQQGFPKIWCIIGAGTGFGPKVDKTSI